jgi:Zn ribbon nucleic-acid-binding protein
MDALTKKTLCPVCGYDLGFEPWKNNSASHETCPSCGIEFGYDDEPLASGVSGSRKDIYLDWRNNWMKNGMKWSSDSKPPDNWDAVEQLRRIGIDVV